MAIAQETPTAQRRGFWVTGVVVFLGWNLTTLLGALLGDALGDPKVYGFDAAAAAAFAALLWPRLRSREAVVVAVLAGLVGGAARARRAPRHTGAGGGARLRRGRERPPGRRPEGRTG